MKRWQLPTAICLIWLVAFLASASWETADRVKETTTTTGTGTLTLLGPVTGFQSFVSGIGDGDTCYYAIAHTTADEWEVGIGTVTDSTDDTLSRDTILASSNSGSAEDFTIGTKTVYCVHPAARTPQVDDDGRIEIKDISSTDKFYISHDGTNNLFETTSGAFKFTGDSSIAADVYVNIDGGTANRGFLRLYDQDSAEYMWLYCSAGSGFIETKGTSASNLHLQYGAGANVRMFNGATSGENPLFTIYGYDSDAGALRNGNWQIGSNGTLILSAASGENIALRPNASSSEGLVCESGKVIRLKDTLMLEERSSDPSEPDEGEAIIWMSDGTSDQTGVGDGDVVIASKAGGSTTVTILHDASSASAWVTP